MLDYQLAFSKCLGQALHCEITAPCVVSAGGCLRGHADECGVRNGEKVGFRSASSFLGSLRIDNKDVHLPFQVLGAWNLIRLLNYDSERCLYCYTSRKQTKVPQSCSSVVAASAQLFYLLLHREVLESSSYSICSISPGLRAVLDTRELGTRPHCIVLPCLSSDFCKFSPNSAVVEVGGYYVHLRTVRTRHFLSELPCLFMT